MGTDAELHLFKKATCLHHPQWALGMFHHLLGIKAKHSELVMDALQKTYALGPGYGESATRYGREIDMVTEQHVKTVKVRVCPSRTRHRLISTVDRTQHLGPWPG